MNKLPTELLAQILASCSLEKLLALALVCRRWHDIIFYAPETQPCRYHYPKSDPENKYKRPRKDQNAWSFPMIPEWATELDEWPSEWNEIDDQHKIHFYAALRRETYNTIYESGKVNMGFVHKIFEDYGFIQLNFGTSWSSTEEPFEEKSLDGTFPQLDLQWIKLGRRFHGRFLMCHDDASQKINRVQGERIEALKIGKEFGLVEKKTKVPRSRKKFRRALYWSENNDEQEIHEWWRDEEKLKNYLSRGNWDPARLFDIDSLRLLESDCLIYPGLNTQSIKLFLKRFVVSFRKSWSMDWTPAYVQEVSFYSLLEAFPEIEGKIIDVDGRQASFRDVFSFIQESLKSEDWWERADATSGDQEVHPLAGYQDGECFSVRLWAAKPDQNFPKWGHYPIRRLTMLHN